MAQLKVVLDGQPLVVKTYEETIIVQEGMANRIRLSPMTALTLTGDPVPINITTHTPPPLTIRPTVATLSLPITAAEGGVQGPPGIQGPPGEPGPPGPSTQWFHGTTDPVNIPGAIPGNIYLNSASGDLFELA
jgi:hypothetical protein